MRAGKIAGMQLVLNNWFLLLILLFSVAGMGVKALTVFSAVLWHELAHAFTAQAAGYSVREIEILPFGGVARIERLGDAASGTEIMMAAAGPVASLAMAAAAYAGMLFVPKWSDALEYYLRINLMLALFNMLPALPLDGGRILRALLAMRLDYQQATNFVGHLSTALSAVLLITVLADFLTTGNINLTFVIAALFLHITAKAEMKAASFRKLRVLAHKKAELTAKGIMPTTHLTATGNVAVGEVVKLFGPEQYHVVLVVDEEFHLRGSLTETQVWEALPSKGLNAKIGQFL